MKGWQVLTDAYIRSGCRCCIGGLFPTPLYYGSAEFAERPASMQACLSMTDRLILPACQHGQAKQSLQRYFSRIPSTRASISARAMRIRSESPACRSLASHTIRPPRFSVTIA